MNMLFIVMIIIATFFIVTFSIGVFQASIQGSDKKRKFKAETNLLEMNKKYRSKLIEIYLAYYDKNIDRVNNIVKSSSAEDIKFLVNFFSFSNRPKEYSSGKMGTVIWEKSIEKFKQLGYVDEAAYILTGVIMDNYNDVLDAKVKEADRKTIKSIISDIKHT